MAADEGKVMDLGRGIASPVCVRFACTIIAFAMRHSVAAVALLAAFSATAWSAEGAGMIKTVSGSATVTSAASGVPLPASEGQRVFAGDRIASGPGSYVGIMLHDDTRLTLGPGGELVIREFQFSPVTHAGGFLVSFLKGTVKVVTGLLATESPEQVRFSTPSGTIGIRGTEFVLDLEPD